MFFSIFADDLSDALLVAGIVMSLCQIQLCERGSWKEVDDGDQYGFVFETRELHDYTNTKFEELANTLERANAEFRVTEKEASDVIVVYGCLRHYLVEVTS